MQELSETRRDTFFLQLCVCVAFLWWKVFFVESDMDNSQPKSLPTCQHFSVGDYHLQKHLPQVTHEGPIDFWLFLVYGDIEGHLAGDRKDRNPYPPLLYIYEFGPFKFKQARGFVPLGRNSPYTTIVVSILSGLESSCGTWKLRIPFCNEVSDYQNTSNSQFAMNFMLRHLSFFGYSIDCYTKTEGSDRKESLSQDCLLSTKIVLFFLRIIKKRPWKTNKMTTEAWAHREEYKYLGHFGVFLLIQKHWGPWRDIRASWITVSEAAKVGSWVHQQFLGSTWERWPISVFFWRCCFWGAYHQVYSVWLWLWAVVVVNFTVGCCRYLSLLLRRAWNTSTLRQLVFVEYMIVHDGNPYDQLTVPTITPAPAGVFYQSMDDEDHSDFGLIQLVASNIVAFWHSKYMTPWWF